MKIIYYDDNKMDFFGNTIVIDDHESLLAFMKEHPMGYLSYNYYDDEFEFIDNWFEE